MEKTEVKTVEWVTPLAVPALSFWASQAMTEFKVGMPGWFSDAMRGAGAALPGNMSQMAGKSAFTKTNTITIGVNGSSTQWGWNSTSGSAFGALSPTTAADLKEFRYFYFSGGRLQLSQSVAATSAGSYRLTFENGLTNTFTTSSGMTGCTFATDASFNTAVGTYFKGYIGQSIDVSIVKI